MKNTVTICSLMAIVLILMAGCTSSRFNSGSQATLISQPLTTIQQIDSFKPEVACSQGLEVVGNNPYEQEFFEKVFARIIRQSRNCSSPKNADLIWEHFVEPLQQSGKVPPDLLKTLWNSYFSRQFVSLPSMSPISQQCYRLAEIKENIGKEYQLKKQGFEICKQGSPDIHFLNAMYVYNTMWAVCKGTD